MPRQTGTPRRRAFNTQRQNLTEARDPLGQVAIAARCRRERRGVELAAEFVEHDHDMELLVGVNAGDDTAVVFCDGGHCLPPFLWLGWHARPGGWTGQGAGLVAQGPLRSRSPDRLFHTAESCSLGRQVRSWTPDGSSRT